MTEKVSFSERVRVGANPSVIEEPENEREYKAWGSLREREIRLDIRDKQQRQFAVPYASIMLVQYMPRNMLCIVCMHFIVTIKGRNLKKLYELLLDEKVRYIQAFNAKLFDEPAANEGKIDIVSIRWQRVSATSKKNKREEKVSSLTAA